VGNGPEGRGLKMGRQDPDDLRKQVERQAKRLEKAEREKPTLIGQTVYIGTLGLILVLPIVGGAYLGNWLDNMAGGYSIRWTISLIVVGLGVGAFNVYFFIRE
jgi:ATP synthase protein I